jgi:hypothetical protein
MKRRVYVILCGLAWVLSGLTARALAETPQVKKSWLLDIRFYDPQRITLTLPGDKQQTTFWYMLFEVINDTGQDVEFFPSFRLVTNTLQVVEGGAGISPSVYDAIFARHKVDHPFLAHPSKITGPLLQGADNRRASVAVFRMFDKEADSFTIYIGGLSGEIARVNNPGFDETKEESKANPRFFILRRTLAITYDLPGDAATRILAKPIRRSREWVMR